MNAIYKYIVDGCIRYIGETSKPPEVRLLKHLEEARGPKVNHRLNWLRSLSQPPAVEIIEWVSPESAASRECYWIALARAYGCKLVNGTDGGEGVNSPTAEVREKISAAQRGKPRSAASIEKMRRTKTGKPLPFEMHEAARIANTGRPRSQKTREKIGAAQLGEKNHQFGKSKSHEHRAKISATLRGKPRPPEVRAKISAGHLRRASKKHTTP